MRILNHFRLLAVIVLYGLASLTGLPVNIAAWGQPAPLTPSQSEALNAYNKTVQDFRSVLKERRAQIETKQKLPDKPGQDLYLARVAMPRLLADRVAPGNPCRRLIPRNFAASRTLSNFGFHLGAAKGLIGRNRWKAW